MDPSVLDSIISRLLDVEESKPGKRVELSESEIGKLCSVAKEIFMKQPNLLELEAPIKILGGIHSRYSSLLKLFEYGGFPPESNYLFLGNYTGQGKQSLETICLLLAYKIKYPQNFFLLRGSHERASINDIYGFYDECKRRFNVRLWKVFTDCFSCLPMAAIVDEKILCIHDGLSPELNNLDQIKHLTRPMDVRHTGLLCDLLLSGPSKGVQGWERNDTGVSYTFGPDKVSDFLQKHDLDLICRDCQVVDGYEFFSGRQLVTIFSAPNFSGEFNNAGAMMHVNENLMCTFILLKPEESKTKFNFSNTTATKAGSMPPGVKSPLYSDNKDTEEAGKERYGTSSRHQSSNPSNETSSVKVFSHRDIEGATNGFSDSSKIGHGGYGNVHKGYLDNTEVAIKMLDAGSKQGLEEFIQELEVLGQLRHQNLVRLIGACFKLRSLVYEFLPNGSLEDCLKKRPRLLTWQMRTRIVYEICSALSFLHSNKPEPLVHGDLKPHNILLDANFESKLADFGLCRFLPAGTTTVAFLDTKPKGTLEYIDPVFLRTGILTPFSDVYSFGVTILRLLTGMEPLGIVAKVLVAYKEKTVMTMVDSTAGHWPTDVAEYLAYFGLRCCGRKRRSELMKEILTDLEMILDEIDCIGNTVSGVDCIGNTVPGVS